jgi:multiple sugar transport system substrate-binding protein
MKRLLLLLVTCVCAVLVGCGGDEGGSSGGSSGSGSGSGEGSGQTKGAKVIDPDSMKGAKGQITYCQGKDTTGQMSDWAARFNKKFSGQGLSVKTVEFPASADEQRNRFVQLQEAKSADCDVFRSDVIWTAEFASQKWLYDLTPYMNSIKDRFIPATLATATYEDKIWGAPVYTNAALLYYRTDRVDSAPATWQDVYSQAADKGGIVFQGAPYEGLTCDWLELAFAAGGTILNEDGSKATIDSPENVAATKLMADAIKQGAAPKAVATYMEPESLTAWQTGKYAFMRNWPYAFGLSEKTKRLKGKFAVAPLPEFEGKSTAGILGGGNNVISAFSKNPGGALAVVDFLNTEEWQTVHMAKYSEPSPLAATYSEPSVKKAIPFAAELKQAVEQSKARPVSPVYPQISQAIYNNVNEALAGRTSAEDAMKKAQSDIDKALETF